MAVIKLETLIQLMIAQWKFVAREQKLYFIVGGKRFHLNWTDLQFFDEPKLFSRLFFCIVVNSWKFAR